MIPKELVDSCHKVVNTGVNELDMPIGIVSHIYNGLYEIIAINSEMGAFIHGAVFPLEQTYCRDVFHTDKTIAITEIGNVAGLQLHPLYVSIPLEAYISAPIHHDDEVWGTINFTSTTLHQPFAKADIQRVEQYAKQISEFVEKVGVISRAPWDV
jgi:GAF domain-containing protein